MPSASAALHRPKILLLGDSLTQTSLDGWGGGLAHRYQRRADVLNRGMSGYNTRWYVEYADQSGIWEEPGKIALVLIFFGANDAALPEHDPHHHVPLEAYQANLKILVAKTKASYLDAEIVLICPPPVHHEQRLAYQKLRYGDKATGILERTLESAGNYAEACKRVGKDVGVPVMDLFGAMKNDGDGDFGTFLCDGLHFSKSGHDFVLKQLLAAIEEHHPALYVKPCPVTGEPNAFASKREAIPSSGPYQEEIDHVKYREAFVAPKTLDDDEEPHAKRVKT